MPRLNSTRQILRAYWLAFSIFVAGLCGSLLTSTWFSERASELDRRRFEKAAYDTLERIDGAVEAIQRVLQMLADAVASRSSFGAGAWQLQIQRLAFDKDYPGVLEVGLVEVDLAPDLVPELQTISPDHFFGTRADRKQANKAFFAISRSPVVCRPLFQFNPRLGDERPLIIGPPVQATNEIIASVESQWPSMTDAAAPAGIQRDEPLRYTTMILGVPDEAIAANWPTGLTKAIVRANNQGKNSAMAGHANRFLKRRFGTRFVYAAIDWERLCKNILAEKSSDISFELFDAPRDKPRNILARFNSAASRSTTRVASAVAQPRLLRMYARKWTAEFTALPSFKAKSTAYRSRVALVGGTLVSALFAGIVASETRGRLKEQLLSRTLVQSSQALDSARKERLKVSRDLHDGAIQNLYALQLGLARLREKSSGRDSAVARQIENAQEMVHCVINELREFLQTERVPSPATDLQTVLEEVINRLQKTGCVECKLDAPQRPVRLTPSETLNFAQIAREALSNSMRHAQATEIFVSLAETEHGFRMEIADNGIGFDENALTNESHGLRSMQERAQELGAAFDLQSSERGTKIVVRLPLSLRSCS